MSKHTSTRKLKRAGCRWPQRSVILLLAIAAPGVVLLGPAGPRSASAQSATPPGDNDIAALRTRTSRTYPGPDGTLKAVISPGPVNYRDSKGDWQPIDSTLVASPSGGYENAANSFKTFCQQTRAARSTSTTAPATGSASGCSARAAPLRSPARPRPTRMRSPR